MRPGCWLMLAVPFPEGYGASVHFAWPGKDYIPLGVYVMIELPHMVSDCPVMLTSILFLRRSLLLTSACSLQPDQLQAFLNLSSPPAPPVRPPSQRPRLPARNTRHRDRSSPAARGVGGAALSRR